MSEKVSKRWLIDFFSAKTPNRQTGQQPQVPGHLRSFENAPVLKWKLSAGVIMFLPPGSSQRISGGREVAQGAGKSGD